jgi:predicted Zn-dependent peptidase
MLKNKHGVLHLLIQVLNDIVKKGVTQKELDEVKGNIQGHLVLNMERTETKCVHNGIEYILYDNATVVPYKDLYKRHYEHITKKDIHEIIRKYFRPENMFVCLVGENVPKMSVVQSYFRWFHSVD